MRRKCRFAILFGLTLGLALGLSACRAENKPGSGPTPTPVVEMAATPPSPGEAEMPPVPTRMAPLRFVIPTPGAEPISDWRPPLYPVPWAISPYDHFYFARPIPADEVNWPLADYRYGGIFFGSTVHTGVDIPAKSGAPILAAGPGTVVWAGWGLYSNWPENKEDPYGLAVAIRHDFGYKDQPLYTIYAHMQRVDVGLGQWVDTGEQIGLVGETGHTTGPHLHFEVRVGENGFFNTYNPELWIAPPQGWGVLVGHVTDTYDRPLHHYTIYVKSYASGRRHTVKTYGPGTVNSDEYYQENMVLSDLAAGWYEITIERNGREEKLQVEIFPGQVTYFTFQGREGFTFDLPPTPGIEALTPTPEAQIR
ncbi:MAG: peptidoglycan DD-metalloendopeptidase family protein [Chloroflexi bacterium]|nr:peptidoglycan DD-metalloendopeptidase family protein [Chloroflexota bacterium]